MSDARDSMMDALVRGFGDDVEKKESARRWLEETVAPSDDSEMKELTARLDKEDQTPKRFRWQSIYLILSVAVTIVLLLPFDHAKQIKFIVPEGFFLPTEIDPSILHAQYSKVSPENRLLIGDPSLSVSEQSKKLWESDPKNPAYFSEYASVYCCPGC